MNWYFLHMCRLILCVEHIHLYFSKMMYVCFFLVGQLFTS